METGKVYSGIVVGSRGEVLDAGDEMSMMGGRVEQLHRAASGLEASLACILSLNDRLFGCQLELDDKTSDIPPPHPQSGVIDRFDGALGRLECAARKIDVAICKAARIA